MSRCEEGERRNVKNPLAINSPSDLIAILFQQAEQKIARRRGQRTGYIYERGPWWFLQYREYEEGKPPRKVTKRIGVANGPGKITRKQAERLAWEEYLAKVDVFNTRPQSSKTISEFVRERFEPDVVWYLKPSGKAHYDYVLSKHVLPILGNFRMRDLLPQHVQSLLRAKLESGLSVQTAIHIRNAISAVFRHAKRMQAFSGDLPTEAVRLPELQPAERHALSWEQVKLVSEHMGRPDLEALVIVLALTGLRIGEALGLKWKRVNLEELSVIMDGESLPGYTLAVRENYVVVPKKHRGSNLYGTVKTKKSSRKIALSSEVWYQLTRVNMASKFTGPDDPVFAAANGNPLDRHNISNRNLKVAGKKANVPWVSWHALRHTNSTLADQAGISVAVRQRILGHAAAEMTLGYTHTELALVRADMEKIGPG
jgi:integrase